MCLYAQFYTYICMHILSYVCVSMYGQYMYLDKVCLYAIYGKFTRFLWSSVPLFLTKQKEEKEKEKTSMISFFLHHICSEMMPGECYYCLTKDPYTSGMYHLTSNSVNQIIFPLTLFICLLPCYSHICKLFCTIDKAPG